MLTQNEIQAHFFPIIKEKGIFYKKSLKVWARVAAEDELIMTVTSDGLETSNVAQKGDRIVKNKTQAREMYVLDSCSFQERYFCEEESLSDSEGFIEYQPIGKIIALLIDNQLLKEMNLPEEFYFEAPWGSAMVCKENDFLVMPLDFSQVYRIARKEFFETYIKM